MEDNSNVMASVHSTVFKESESLEGKGTKIEGYDFNQGVNYSQLLKSMVSTGFQASNFGDAIEVVNQMVCFSSQQFQSFVNSSSSSFNYHAKKLYIFF